MRSIKIQSLIIITILALATIGASYAGLQDKIHITGTVKTGTVDLVIKSLVGTWIWKEVSTHEMIIHQGTANSDGTDPEAFNDEDHILVAYASGNINEENDDLVTVTWHNLFPLGGNGDYIVQLMICYEGSIPVRVNNLNASWNGEIIELPDGTYGDFLEYLYQIDYINFDLHSESGLIEKCTQLHQDDCFILSIKGDILQDNRFQNRTGSASFSMEVIQWNEVDCEEPNSSNPSISVEKNGPIFSYAGDGITYIYDVQNTGDVELSNINVFDDKCGFASYLSGDEDEDNRLDINENWLFECNYTPVFSFPYPLENIAIASGVYDDQIVEDMDNFTLYPFILRKNVLLYWEGETINYSDPETVFTVEMIKNDELLDVFLIKESTTVRLWLSEGTYEFCEVEMPEGYESAYDCASFTTGEMYPDFSLLNIILFDLSIEKTGPDSALPEELIVYNYTVNNAGPASVAPIVRDNLCIPVYVSGDTNENGLIDPDETWFYMGEYIVSEEIGSIVENIANVTDAEGFGLPSDHWWLGGDIDQTNNVDNWSVLIVEEKIDENNPPYIPYNPNPVNNSTGVSYGSYAQLKFLGGDPDVGDTVNYTIYFGNETDPEIYGITGPWSYDSIDFTSVLTEILKPSTIYYWRIVAEDNSGAVSVGPLWTFITSEKEIISDDDDDDDDDSAGGGIVETTFGTTSTGTIGKRLNSPPVANGSGPYYGYIGEIIIFNGSQSMDSDGFITNYTWNFGDGSFGYGVLVTHSYSKSGVYSVSLTVTDNLYEQDKDKTISVLIIPNRPPSDPVIKGPSDGFSLISYSYVVMSIDPDNNDISYSIDWGDGEKIDSPVVSNGTAFSAIHSWSDPGEYTIKVTCDDGETISTSEFVVIIEEPVYSYSTIIVVLAVFVLLMIILSWIALSRNKKSKED